MTVPMVPTMINERWELLLPEHRAARPEWPYWEKERLASMAEHIGPGDVVYDIGAEEGDFPALWRSWGADVVAFEPNPKVWPNMRVIWEANGLGMPLGSFVGFAGHTDTPAHEQLDGTGWFIGDWPPAAYGDVIGDHGFMNLCERPDVPSITLNTVAAGLMPPPTAITIDVEGAEMCVLQGAAAVVLTEHRPTVWCSVHPLFMEAMYGYEPNRLHALMAVHGYTGQCLAIDHEEHWLYEPKAVWR